MSKLSDDSLLSIIRTHRADSLGAEDGQLSTERATALNHYHGRAYGNEVEGRSQVVSRDLAEAVDWVMPAVMKVFTQSGRLAEFDPVGPEDEELSAQESDYVNQVLMKDNPGFMVLHDAIKDTLLLKNGYVKHWWEVEQTIDEESYEGLTLDQIQMLENQLKEEGAQSEVLGQESYFVGQMPPLDPMGQPMGPMPVEIFNVKLKITRKRGKLTWVAVPSEEVRVSKKCRGSLQDSPFTEHVTRKTRSELREMGMDADFVESLAAYGETKNSTQSYARDSTDDESDSTGGSTGDKSMDEIEYCEAYIRVDYDGDGIAELRKIVTVADKLPPGEDWNEPIPAVPMTGFVAKRIPHRHVGESLDDEIADLQEIMTVLKRQLLDNIYLNNNSEIVINEDANLRDFMTRTPGGIKRTKGSNPVGNAVMALVTKPIIGDILPVIDHFEASKETRTGISKASTGLDPDILQNTTKGAFMENLNRASQKTEMITRMLAETGVKESVLQAHAILMRHQDKARTVQLRGKWVPVNPQEWRRRSDLSVRVGLGTGSEEEKRDKLSMLSALQQQLMQALTGAPPEVYARLHAMFEDIANTLGVDAPEKYAVTPGSEEHNKVLADAANQAQQGAGANQLAEAEQVKAQAAMQIAQVRQLAQREIEAARQQFNRDKEMLNAQMKQRDAEEDRRLQVVLERMKQQGEDNRAAMTNEVKLMIEGMKFDLGRPGISAGVQGAAGAPLGGEQHKMPDGSVMPGPTMDQQTMPPDGMGA